MLVKEMMSRDIIWCTPSDTAQTAAKLMKDRGVGTLPVVSDGMNRRLEGIVTDRDLCCTIVAGAQLAESHSRRRRDDKCPSHVCAGKHGGRLRRTDAEASNSEDSSQTPKDIALGSWHKLTSHCTPRRA